VPLLLTIPNAASGYAKPATGWPVVIFQHGITRNRSDMLAIADALAQAGQAVVAIDLPLHGITDLTNPLYAGNQERTFNLDFVHNDNPLNTGPDGMIDSSGTHFINLNSMLTTRDNVRQAVADLFTLTATLPFMDYDGGGADFDGANIYFLGHSLGAIVGVPYLAVDDRANAATLGMPGGGLVGLLITSPTFGPTINAGLQAAGLTPGNADYQSFLVAFQTAVDSADPINYGTSAATHHPIHMIEVVGGAGNPSDQVIPNNALPAWPLSGTDPLWRVMGLTPTRSSMTDAAGLHVLVRFSAGAHSSLLIPPSPSLLAVTMEMQGESAAFLASDGTVLHITDGSVIAP
jgi:dienelactone hydrolase